MDNRNSEYVMFTKYQNNRPTFYCQKKLKVNRSHMRRAPVAVPPVRICEQQCNTSLSGCLLVQFRMSTAPVYGCHISILLCTHVCKIIAFVNFQEITNIFFFFIDCLDIMGMILISDQH